MKKQNLFTILLITSLLCIISCDKEGEPGPAGQQGPQGIEGPAGVPGSQIYNGSGAPASSLGSAGDYYVDKDNAQMYGPKTTTGWGPALTLKGADGAAGATGEVGAPGSKILSGDNVPASGLGVAGDFYFDKTNAIMYGPKTSCCWGTGTPLRIGQVISYVITRPAALSWSAGHQINISNSLVPIPRDVRDNGIILGYILIRGTGTADIWHPIPGQLWVSMGAVRYFFISLRVMGNSLWIHAYGEDGSDLSAGENPPDADKLRILMIPADQVNTVSRMGDPVDYNDYEAVKAYYNIAD